MRRSIAAKLIRDEPTTIKRCADDIAWASVHQCHPNRPFQGLLACVPATPTLCEMELTEIVFTLGSKERAERLSGYLSSKGYACRVVAGDGSRTIWQVRAWEHKKRVFADDEDLERFIDETLRPLQDEFAATLEGGTLTYSGGGASAFATMRLRPAEQRETEDE
jgi:hypothetical protein